MYLIMKIGISALVIVIVSEVAKKNNIFGALIAALPLTSLMAMIWMKLEKVNVQQIADLSSSIFWLVIPSLLFFALFPILLKRGTEFWLSFSISAGVTVILYLLLRALLNLLRLH